MNGVRPLPLLLAAGIALTTISACSSDSKADGTVDVVAAFYPLQFVAERVGGAAVKVTNLARPGVEPHDLELEPKQLAGIADADLALYLKGFQPAVDEAVEAEAKKTSFDVATVQPLDDAADGEENGKDPHVWLDPTRLATIADQVAERLAAVDKDNADAYKLGAVKLKIDLTALDEEYTKGLQNCARTDIVTSHAAFGYLAKRYNLTQVPISGLSPEAEPSPQRVAEVAALAKEKGVTTIFFETLVSPKVAQTLATEVGARAEVLDPIEGLRADAAPGEDYLSVMRQNLTKLREALGCR
ncbi:metal ABC transporter substrate-binding protein [Virgisporangium aurantiacum]|uniref:metal ABC transporter substrate-binding protein n=1 Tax=Virgisporangium aurantiacum TaxID=175570 RepID=UPI00194EB6CC